MRRTLVKVVAVHEEAGKPCWPHIDHDYEKELKRIMQVVEGNNPDMDFDVVKCVSVMTVKETYDEDVKKYDGVLVLLFTCWKGIDQFYARQSATGIPTIIADVPFCGSGSVLTQASATVRKEKLQAVVLSTLNYAEVAEAVRLFDVMAKMKQTVILSVSERDFTKVQAWYNEQWGCKFVNKKSVDLVSYYEKADEEEAKVIAERWIQSAVEVVEPSKDEIIQSAKLHIAIREMMKDCGAHAVTLDCLTLSYGGEYGKKGHMYPCLSHYEMLSQGIVAVCESDHPGTITSLVFRYLTNKPGFVSDPAIDTSSNQIIYAHCVACPKVYGYDDKRTCQFAIRSHAEDKKGASVQVYFPAGEKLTTAMIYAKEFNPSVVHSATSVGNVGLQEGCRSKLSAETNAEAILNNWVGNWHRVTVFGDYRKQIERLFKLKGISYVQEDKE